MNSTNQGPRPQSNWPDNKFKVIPALLGLPVERHAKKIKHPVIIISFIGAFFAVYYSSLQAGDLKHFFMQFGFTPKLFFPSKNYISLISSFFVHANLFHLLGNAYYFYVFGDDIEDQIGFRSFVTLLILGHISGVLLHSFFTSDPNIPLVGASAGVSALLGYYTHSFPRRKISYCFFLLITILWIHLPAYIVFFWKFGWELLFASANFSTGVALWAHVGGFAFGLLYSKLRNN